MVSSSRSRSRCEASRPHRRRRRWTALAWLVTTAVTALSGCSVQEPDLARWQTTLGGPKRLSAVVLFDKYDLETRVKAAMSLAAMEPRKGKHVGIERLVKGSLACDPDYVKEGEPCQKHQLNPQAREEIIAEVVPLLIAELSKPAPKPTQGGQAPPDPSFKFKDAAYLMLTYEKTQLIANRALRRQLEVALTQWAMADFERRLNDRAQAYGMEQLLRHIGPVSVKQLPSKMVKNSRSLKQISNLIAKIGSKDTKEAASKQLVKIATHVASEDWKKENAPKLEEANRKAGYTLNKAQFTEQLVKYQSESLSRVLGSMKKIGGQAVVDWALATAANNKVPKDLPEADYVKRRALALAAITGHVDRRNTRHAKALFKLVNNPKTPPAVVDQGFARIRELPREVVIADLYKFFKKPDWKLRALAGATILKISKVKHIDEFLGELKAKAAKNFDPNEAITYGAYLADLKEGDPLKALEPHMKSGDAKVRIAALSYWRAVGDKTMLDKVKPYEQDRQKAPKCEAKKEDAFECTWECVVGKETKKVTTVGQYVSYCVKPRMSARAPKKKGATKKKDAPKDDKKDG